MIFLKKNLDRPNTYSMKIIEIGFYLYKIRFHFINPFKLIVVKTVAIKTITNFEKN